MKTYIIVLLNNHLLFKSTKPKKKGNYLKDVRLFETSKNIGCQDVCKWTENDYLLDGIKEVEDWD